jgi:Flp pilus assembly protein TadD
MAGRWNDYGIGLLEQRQYGPASEAFRRAAELDPTNPSLLVNAAIAEMRTERFGPERSQWAKAAALLECALKLGPQNARARFYRALVLRGMGKTREAADELGPIAAAYPRDREVQRQYGQTLYALGRFAEAKAAFEVVIAVDPTDAAAYTMLGPLYRMEGRLADADRAESLYKQWRDDPVADGIAARFFAAHPQWSDERITSHVHSNGSPDRPILTGQAAAPAK